MENNSLSVLDEQFVVAVKKWLEIISRGSKNEIKARLCIEGNIGVGKTTFTRALGEIIYSLCGIKVDTVYEPVERWQELGILKTFYENPKQNAYKCQTMFFATRVLEYLDHAKKNPNSKICLLDRWLTDHLFMENLYETGFVDDKELEYYRIWNETFEKVGNSPISFCIYLKSSPQKCFERIKARGRGEESTISFDYLESLHKQHEDFFKSEFILYSEEKIPVITVDYEIIEKKDDSQFQDDIKKIFIDAVNQIN